MSIKKSDKKVEFAVLAFACLTILALFALGEYTKNRTFNLLAFLILAFNSFYILNGTAFQQASSVNATYSADGSTASFSTQYANVKNNFTDGLGIIFLAVGLFGGILESLNIYRNLTPGGENPRGRWVE